MKFRLGTASVTAVALTMSGTVAALAADVNASSVAAYPTSSWTPPSSDPSGIAFIPGKGLLVSDAEIEETAFTQPITHNNNLFMSTLDGVKTGHGSTVGWSNEPTGVAYVSAPGNPWNGHLFVTDDDRKEVFDISSAGADGQFGTADDGSRTSFKTSPFGNSDPEDVAFDSTRNELWLAGGLSTIISRVNPGADNNFATTADNVTKNFSITQLDPTKPPSPEGMAYDPERQTIIVLDGESQTLFELARNGAELNRIHLNSIDMQSPGGVTLNPASSGSARTYYIADRGLDPNGTRPANCPAGSPPDCEPFNDGVIHEVRVSNMPTIANRPPLADAGEDEVADTQETVTLVGSGEDGETPPSPAALTYSWTRVSGVGDFTLGTPNAPTTTAMFTQAGSHTLRLTVSDGALTDFDDVVVHVFAPGDPRTVNIPIRIGDDDAQESIGGTSDGFTDVQSADNELGNTNGSDTTKVMTGLRFTRLPVASHSTVDSARVQFSVDEAGSAPASYVIRGHLIGDAPPFIHGRSAPGSAKNITSRTPTAASVAWNNVPAWTVIREEGPKQRTPELAPILQEVVNQPTWTRGNATVLTFVNAPGNTGRRTAEAKDGRIPPYLTVTFRTPLPNVAPIVNAGSDSAVTLPGLATLDGTVTDDGKVQATPTTTWSKVSGPGTVNFGDPGLVDTTAGFSEPGSYTLRLTANDGALSASDDVVVVVRQTPKVSAGQDLTVVLPADASLDGTVTDDGPVQTKWSKESGPGTVAFADAKAVDTTATFSEPGSYTLRLTADDGALIAFDDVVVVVRQTPKVSAGPDLTVVVPAAATLDGTVTDDGPVQTTWSKVSGPGTVTFGDKSLVDTTVTFSEPGSYTLRLTAHDGTLTESDDVVVMAQQAPNVSAGPDLTITMPAAASLDGALVSPGFPGAVTFEWTKASGPGTVTFGARHELDTTVTFSQAGIYVLAITATNSALKAADQLQVTVEEPAAAPVVAPRVTGALTEPTVAAGELTRFTGTVSPAAAGQPVQLQRLDGDRWVTVATTQLSAGSSAAYSFDIRRKASGSSRYRTFVPSYAGMASTAFDGPARGLRLRVYRADITAVRHAHDEFVTVSNTGAVRIDLRGWLLVNRRTGAQRTLPEFLVRSGDTVRIHSGHGRSDRNDLYLKSRDMWGRHGTAVLRNERSVLLDRLGY